MNLHPFCKIYRGECTSGETNVEETVRSVEVHWAEHDINKKSEPSKHLFLNVGHSFNLSVLLTASKNTRTRKNLEAFSIAIMKLSLNK